MHITCMCSTLFSNISLCRCFARLQRETFRHFPVTRCIWMCSCSRFLSLPLIFTLLAASISHRLYKIFKFFFQRNWSPLWLFFNSRSCSFSVIHVNVDIRIQSKQRLGLVVVFFFFLSKSLGGEAIYRRNARDAWNGGRTYVWTYVRFC